MCYRNQGRGKQMARWGNSMSPLKELQAHPSDVYALSRRERLCCSPWGLWTECAPQMASQSPSGASSPRGTRCSRKPCGRRPSTLVLLLHFCGREGGGGAESSRNSGRLVPEWEMGLRLSPERQGGPTRAEAQGIYSPEWLRRTESEDS